VSDIIGDRFVTHRWGGTWPEGGLVGFPRLTERSLPSGVGDIRYSIIADDLTGYEVSADFIATKLGPLHG
jgi:hypothetical protein